MLQVLEGIQADFNGSASGGKNVSLADVIVLGGCATDSYAAKGAGKGAASGALAGAVGGMASALIFGGDVGEAAARGAVYGGATGAVAGTFFFMPREQLTNFRQVQPVRSPRQLLLLNRPLTSAARTAQSATRSCTTSGRKTATPRRGSASCSRLMRRLRIT